MDRKKITLNSLFIGAFLVIVIFAVSVFVSSGGRTSSDFPKIEAKTPLLGEKNAPIRIIEYGDFECPYCHELAVLFRQAYLEYEGQLAIYWKDFPLYSLHENSLAAAKAGRCAQKQDKFWEMHDLIFQNQQNLSDELYLSIAAQLNLNTDKFIRCMNNNETLGLVEKDIKEGLGLGVTGTPYFYVGNYVITELIDYDQLKEIIDYYL